MPANRHRILLHGGESRLKKIRQPRCKAGRLPSSDPEINDLFFISYFDVFVVTASLVVKCKAPLNEQFHLRVGVRNLLHRISRLPDDNEQPNFC